MSKPSLKEQLKVILHDSIHKVLHMDLLESRKTLRIIVARSLNIFPDSVVVTTEDSTNHVTLYYITVQKDGEHVGVSIEMRPLLEFFSVGENGSRIFPLEEGDDE